MKAVIVGAGIAGLVAARQLGLAGWHVEVLERSAQPRPDGYMMDFFGPGISASERIGLYPRLSAAAYRIDSVSYVNPAGRQTAHLDYALFSRLAGGKVLSLLRPDLEACARQALQDVPVGRVDLRYGCRIEQVLQDPGKVIVRGGGGQWEADALIGADGLHSQVRAEVFGPATEYLRDLGMRAAAYTIDEPQMNMRLRNRFVLTDSIGRTAGLYGLSGGRVAAFLVYRPEAPSRATAGAPDTRQRLRAHFRGLGPSIDRLLALCPEDPYDDLVAQVIMPQFHRGHTVLLGDAGGAVSLLAGQGGSLAVAGAALLGEVLGPVDDAAAIPGALAEFERRWRPTVLRAQDSGRRAAATFLPRNLYRLLQRRLILKAAGLPLVNRLVARQIINRLVK